MPTLNSQNTLDSSKAPDTTPQNISEIPSLEDFQNPSVKMETEFDQLKDKALSAYEAINNPTSLPYIKNQKILELALTLQKMDEYVQNYDATGAQSSEKFHSHISSYMRDKDLTLDERFHLKTEDSDRDLRLVGVSLDNLPYVNKRGSRVHGDGILSESVELIESKLLEAGFEVRDFDIVHQKGSDFAVFLQNIGEDEEDFVENVTNFMSAVHDQSPGSAQTLETDFPPKLVVCSTDRNAAVKAFNAIQDKKRTESDYVVPKDPFKVLTGIMVSQLEFQREYSVLYSLSNNVLKNIEDLYSQKDFAPDSADKLNGYARYFNKYVKRFYEDTEFDNFGNLLPQDSKENIAEQFAEIREKLEKTTKEIAIKKVFEGWRSQEEIDEIIKQVAEQISETEENKVIAPILKPEKNSSLALNIYPSNSEIIPIEEAEKIYKTEKRKEFDKLSQLYGSFDLILTEIHNSLWAEDNVPLSQEQIDLVLELVGTISKEMNVQDVSQRVYIKLDGEQKAYIPDILEELIESYKSKKINIIDFTQSLETVRELYKSSLEAHFLRHDSMTGLVKREIFYERTGGHVTEALLKGDKGFVVFDDVNFLRYTNDLSGRRVGNLVISACAKSMEDGRDALQSCNLAHNIEISRYAGDEFITYFSTPKENYSIDDLTPEFHELAESMGLTEITPQDFYVLVMLRTQKRHRITGIENSSEFFIPHEIGVGVGICSIEQGIEVVKKSIEAGDILNKQDEKVLSGVLENLPKYRSGELAPDNDFKFFALSVTRAMVRVSDKLIEINKSNERFQTLFSIYKNLRKEPNLDENSLEWKAFRILLSYSQKSINEIGIDEFASVYNSYPDAEVPKEETDKLFGKRSYNENIESDPVFAEVIGDMKRETRYYRP